MDNYINKFKTRKPEETVSCIKKFFQEKNFHIKESNYVTEADTYYSRIELLDNNNDLILRANGKGMTESYSKASGYAELYERYCNKIDLFTNPLLFQYYINNNYNNHHYYLDKNEKILNFLMSIEFSVIPKIAIAHIMPNILHPSAVLYSLKVTKQNGVYEPAINKNIEQWSNIWNTFFAFLFGFNPWYMLDIVYKSIIVTPYIELLTTPYPLWCIAANTIHRTNATIPNAPPTMCDVILKISSPFV